MSKYDEERKKILERMQKNNVSFEREAEPSKYAADRSADTGMSKYEYDRLNPPQPITTQMPGLPNTANVMNSPILQQSQQYAQTNPAPFEETKIGRDIPVIGSVLRGLDAVATNPVTEAVANIGRSLYTPGGTVANVAGFAGSVGSTLGRLAPKLGSSLGGRVAQEAIKEGVTGIPLGAGQALATGHDDLGDVAQQGLYGGVLGAAGGAAAPLIGRGIQAIRNARNIPDALPPQESPAPLPASRYESDRALSEGTVLQANETPVYGQGEARTFVDGGSAPETRFNPSNVEVGAPKSELPKAPEILKAEPPPANVSDELDNIIPDETPHPRVRDKLNTYADDLINSAKAELAASRNRLSSNPVDIYTQYGKLGAGYMLKGTVKLADFTEVMVKEFGDNIRPHVREIFKRSKEEYKVLKFNVEKQELGLSAIDATKLKDLSNLRLSTSDVYRNFQGVFGSNFASVKKSILDPFDGAKNAYVSSQKSMAKELHDVVVKGLGITKGSKDSALVQKFGEGQITLDELKQQAPRNWQKIVQANEWFRQKYDTLINQVNDTVKKIYPNNPDKIVPKRENYYRHFRELNGLSGLRNLFESPSQIDPKLSGISPFTEPKTKWASFKQKRGMGEFKNDAVGGFLEYIPAASYAMHIDPQINVFRTLAKNLAEQTTDSRNMNNFIKFLNNYANDLAGKTSPFDRWVEEIGGRKTLQVMSWANNRVKSNVILGNVRSTLAQMANIPQGAAFAKQHSAEGALRTVSSVFQPNEAMQSSTFMKERYLGKDFRRFNTRIIEQPRRFAEWMMETSDRVGTSFVWNSAYAKGKALKAADPVKYADDHTRRLVAGRGVGEAPLLQKSKVFQVIAPFQLEVANLWKVMREFVSEKDFAGIATLFAANFLLNKAVEKATGSGVTFDPIDAVWDAATQPDLNAFERVGRVGGEVLSNVPLGQTLAGMYPEFGTNLYGVQLPTRKKLFGDNDPTRFGEGLVLTKGVQDPLFKMVLPFGGNQLKKTIVGADALIRGGAYTDNVLTTGFNIEDKKLKFNIEKTPAELSRGLLFGAPATGSGQEYYKNDRRPLGVDQTKTLSRSSDPSLYNNLQKKREIETQQRKINELRKDKSIPEEKKREQITRLSTKIQQLQQQPAK